MITFLRGEKMSAEKAAPSEMDKLKETHEKDMKLLRALHFHAEKQFKEDLKLAEARSAQLEKDFTEKMILMQTQCKNDVEGMSQAITEMGAQLREKEELLKELRKDLRAETTANLRHGAVIHDLRLQVREMRESLIEKSSTIKDLKMVLRTMRVVEEVNERSEKKSNKRPREEIDVVNES